MKDRTIHRRLRQARSHPICKTRVVLILPLAGLVCAAALLAGPSRRASAQTTAASWSLTGHLNAPRRGQTATLLPNGKVLVVGGYLDVDAGSDSTPVTAELYDPATGTWSYSGSLHTGRIWHTATLLTNGRVLVAGGAQCVKVCGPNQSAELYDPATGTWSTTGNLKVARTLGHTATLLPDGKVLVVGGSTFQGTAVDGSLKSAELYEPTTGTWSSTGSLNEASISHTATLLQEGKVLITGGFNNCSSFHCSILNRAGLYDPASGMWSDTGNLNTPRFNHTATLLPGGKVLVGGGAFDWVTQECSNSAELYDPTTGVWSYTGNLIERRGLHTATLLLNGKVLVAGAGDPGNSAELYDPATGIWNNTADLNEGRDSHSAILLPSGIVLVAAGGVGFSGSSSAELYDPGTTAGPNTVQFSASSYSVSEGGGIATINVTRTGDTSAPATVKYATSDATDVNFQCNPATAGQITGAASRKCDYHLASGRLRFAAGETSKQIILSIVNDVYVEPAETLTITLSNPTDATLGTLNTAAVNITDNSGEGGGNPIDGTAFYVRMLYVDLLSREADPAGNAGWVHRIDFCGQPGEPPPPCDRVTVGGDGFLRSTEFFDREFFVIRLYRTALGRILRYDEVGDLAFVSGFVTSADLELNKQELVTDIMAHPEFGNIYNSLSNAQYVDTMISTAAVTLPAAVRDGWVNALNGATMTRAQVFRALSERAEVSARYLHEAQVVSCYYGFFTRNPDGAYLDFLQRLDNGEITLGDLANAFINAAEYRQRFGP